jgi:hypothetical protein
MCTFIISIFVHVFCEFRIEKWIIPYSIPILQIISQSEHGKYWAHRNFWEVSVNVNPLNISPINERGPILKFQQGAQTIKGKGKRGSLDIPEEEPNVLGVGILCRLFNFLMNPTSWLENEEIYNQNYCLKNNLSFGKIHIRNWKETHQKGFDLVTHFIV